MTSVATFFFAKLKIESMSDDKKKMTLEWKGNFRFEAKNPNGLTVNFDAPKIWRKRNSLFT